VSADHSISVESAQSASGRRARRRRRGGFSLLEMLVVGVVGVIVLTFLSNAWKWYARSTGEIGVALQLTRELKLATDALAQDFGPALAARTVDGTQLQFNFDVDGDGVAQWDAPDTVIEYALNGTLLRRHNLADATVVPLARQITGLEAEVVGGHLQVHLTAGHRNATQDVTLELREATP